MQTKTKFITSILFLISFSITAQISLDTFPDFELKNIEGEAVKSETLINPEKETLILLYGSYGNPCNKSVTILNELRSSWSKNHKLDIKVVALDGNKSQKWLEINGKSDNSFFDDSKFFIDKVGIKGCPLILVYSPNKKILYGKNGFIHEEQQRDNLISEINYQRALKTTKTGVIEINYDNGNLHYYRTVKNQMLNGRTKQYSRLGTLTLIGNYTDGKKTGEWQE